VVSNLTRNAVEAPRKAQELVLVLAARAVDRDWVEVSLADNAAGIPDSLRDRIFLRFESSKNIGSGIGLPFCRDIISAHGGRIWFETSPETGTTFFFTLRRADRPSAEE
jgi:signal transduction histidine kinase